MKYKQVVASSDLVPDMPSPTFCLIVLHTNFLPFFIAVFYQRFPVIRDIIRAVQCIRHHISELPAHSHCLVDSSNTILDETVLDVVISTLLLLEKVVFLLVRY